MSLNLKGAVVVITGASSGIGQATAQAFARHGSRLVLAARNGDALNTVAAQCRRLGGQAEVMVTDVTDAAAVKALAEKAQSLGRIDVWISNVGVGAVGRFEETPIEAHEQIIRANLIGHINDAHAVMPIFLRQQKGVFINMISLGGFAAAPFATAYSASKFGLRGFSEALRAELADKPNIHVCDIYPAFVDTPGLKHGANYVEREITAPPPLLDPRQVAAAIVHVARHPKPTTTVGVVTNATRLAHLLAPNLAARSLARLMSAYFKRAAPAGGSDGNLYAPSRDAARIDGGLRSHQALSPTFALGLTALGLIAVAAVVAQRQHSHRQLSHRQLSLRQLNQRQFNQRQHDHRQKPFAGPLDWQRATGFFSSKWR
ncbi:SDR family oxidoreductase [Rhizobium sp. SSA_523]|uniref:SDR family oxidoreductase n=1 Tax=Rhizobium sp. SSA_523 TaxID=2952477 RepID=UPI00209134FA|nr:SDR family oxidoreductase [Rhizobium sp. SSA_523]MCO5732212.1 SDR family oxidoreductase [Rhizobium sp. SSA_523]WKC21376.1 SDR family oxidoreductase [Rhizobium sp. SSA_523]